MKARLRRQDVQDAADRLHAVTGIHVELYPAGTGTQWWISPHLGLPFGALGHTKAQAIATLDHLTATLAAQLTTTTKEPTA